MERAAIMFIIATVLGIAFVFLSVTLGPNQKPAPPHMRIFIAPLMGPVDAEPVLQWAQSIGGMCECNVADGHYVLDVDFPVPPWNRYDDATRGQ